MGRCSNDFSADALEKTLRLGAEGDNVYFDTLLIEFTDVIQGLLEHVGIQTTAEAPIGGNGHYPDPLDFTVEQEWMRILGFRTRDMANHASDFLGVGAGRQHL